MNELKPTSFETADALDRFRAVRRGMPYKTLWPSDVDEAIEALEDKLNRRPTPENNPITLDQLRQMDGEPVWIVTHGLESSGKWELVEFPKRNFKGREVITLANIADGQYDGFADTYGKTWLAYARKPEVE